MILNILLALVSLFTDNLSEKRYLDEYEPARMELYDFTCDGLYYEFAGENEVNLVRDETLIIELDWIVLDISLLHTIAYNNINNVCYVGDIVIPDSVEYKGKKYKVASINSYAFSYSRGLKSLTFTSDIPVKFPSKYAGLPKMDIYDFGFNRELTTVTYYDSTTTISRQLHRCPSLKTINFPYKLEKIERSFIECGLTEVDIDNHGEYNPSCFTIEECFDNSTLLRKFKFPECDTLVLKNNSFAGCYNIEEFVIRPCSVIVQEDIDFLYHSRDEVDYAAVISESIVPPEVILRASEGSEFINGYRRERMLYVPDESISAYREAPYWKDFWRIRPISEYNALQMVEIESPVADTDKASEILLDSNGAELHVSVSEPTEVSVWSIQGAQIWRGRVADDTTLSLPHGMYIITTPTSTMKYSH